jgi:ATP-dependent DNA ligase
MSSAVRFLYRKSTSDSKGLPEGDVWNYELKFDGYRALILKDHE